jgi:hypothetical protein
MGAIDGGTMHHRLIALSTALALIAAACSGSSGSTQAAPSAPDAPDGAAAAAGAPAGANCPTEGAEWETALLYIEHNAADEDTGVHGLFGGAAWSELCIWDPNGELILVTEPLGQLKDLTVADLFFESREPSNTEVAIEEIFAAFPEGEYRVAGTDFEGVARVGGAVFTHRLPAEPDITAPALAEDPETAAAIPAAGVVVRWEPVTETLGGDPVRIAAYEVIVTKENHEDPDARSRPVYNVHVAPGASSLSVPDEFFEPGEVYELEVIAIEESGNQTIGLGFFATAGA